MKHELKIWPQYYCRVADGSKTSVKQYDAYLLYADGTDSALIPKSLVEFLIENELVDFRKGEKN